eukprot:365931-Chlamydomonas_euryale.AAC.3
MRPWGILGATRTCPRLVARNAAQGERERGGPGGTCTRPHLVALDAALDNGIGKLCQPRRRDRGEARPPSEQLPWLV